jgi:hypothetical protein
MVDSTWKVTFEGVLASIRGKDGMVSDTKTPIDRSDKEKRVGSHFGNPFIRICLQVHQMQYARMEWTAQRISGMPRGNGDKENHGRLSVALAK